MPDLPAELVLPVVGWASDRAAEDPRDAS